mmetsp:Transcript_44280/g.146742  ORF Transcript_44280/g.146742 Transcript_44280/m.146742 type:complete len:349 (+) Transcript_44280:395-1441(+)
MHRRYFGARLRTTSPCARPAAAAATITAAIAIAANTLAATATVTRAALAATPFPFPASAIAHIPPAAAAKATAVTTSAAAAIAASASAAPRAVAARAQPAAASVPGGASPRPSVTAARLPATSAAADAGRGLPVDGGRDCGDGACRLLVSHRRVLFCARPGPALRSVLAPPPAEAAPGDGAVPAAATRRRIAFSRRQGRAREASAPGEPRALSAVARGGGRCVGGRGGSRARPSFRTVARRPREEGQRSALLALGRRAVARRAALRRTGGRDDPLDEPKGATRPPQPRKDDQRGAGDRRGVEQYPRPGPVAATGRRRGAAAGGGVSCDERWLAPRGARTGHRLGGHFG